MPTQFVRFTLPMLMLGVLFTGVPAFAQETDPAPTPPTIPTAPNPDKPAAEAIPVDDIRTLVEVLHKIKSDYVEAVDDKKLIENAMRGMLAGLDPHSAYLDADDYEDLQEGTSGEFGGLGIEIGIEEGFVKVVSPIDDTPAQQAGVQSGDNIVRIDDTPVKGISVNDAVKMMRGKPGTDVTLTIVREGEQKPLVFKLTRALVKVASVRSRMLEPGFAYLRIAQFQAATGDDLLKQLADLKQQAAGKLHGLILDLRNNPGGILGGAVAVADAFLESGLIVYTDGRVADSKLEFSAKPPDLLAGAPLIVLINEGSASASEIVAGALQDRGRAVIMGRRSFGKGSVQTILPMNNKSALKLTTARYFTPSGRSIQAEGIKPDITIDKVKVAAIKAAAADFVKEADLNRHLANPKKNEHAEQDKHGKDDKSGKTGEAAMNGDKHGDKNVAKDAEQPPLAERDYELYEAFNMLKGMALLSSRAKP